MDRVIDIKENRLGSALYDIYTHCQLPVGSLIQNRNALVPNITVKFSVYQYPLEFNSILMTYK